MQQNKYKLNKFMMKNMKIVYEEKGGIKIRGWGAFHVQERKKLRIMVWKHMEKATGKLLLEQ